MKKIYLSALGLMVCGALSAQYDVTSANALLNVGESITYHTADPSTFSKGTGGGGKTWDYSSLSSTGTVPMIGHDSASAPKDAAGFSVLFGFSGIDRVIEFDDYLYLYYMTNSYVDRYMKMEDQHGSLPNKWAIVGHHKYDNSECMGCSIELLEFPATYDDDKITSTMKFTFTDPDGANYFYDGRVETELDALGTLTLPGGLVVNDVQRFVIEESYDEMDSFSAMNTKIGEADHITIEWRANDNRSALIRYEMFEGGSYHQKYGDREKLYYIDAASGAIGLNTIHKNLESVKVFDNAHLNQAHVVYNVNHTADVQVRMLDINGRVMNVLADETQAVGGYNLVQPLNDVAAGTYLIEVSIDGESTTRKLIVR